MWITSINVQLVLEVRDGQLRCVASKRHPRAVPQQLDNATGDPGCQIENVVDRDCAVETC
jgi:hypothetical protein